MYRVVLTTAAEKFLHKKADRRLLEKLSEKIDNLAANPFAPNPNATKMKDLEQGYRLRIGDWRMVYEVDQKTQTLIIWRIDHRSSVYKP